MGERFSATFALPVKGLSGRYAVRTGNNSVGFTVEEYKRPTFEVRLDEITARYQAGDTFVAWPVRPWVITGFRSGRLA